MNTIAHRFLMAAATCSALFISGCDRPPDEARRAVTNTIPGGVQNTSELSSEKINAYVDGYNKLVANFGLEETRKSYLEADIPNRTAKDDINLPMGLIHQAIGPLKSGRAVKSDGMAELDDAADRLIVALEKLVSQLNALEPYYKAKSYRDDQLVKGKSQDPLLRTAFDDAMTAREKFEALLDVQAKKRDDALLDSLKSSGNLTAYNVKLGVRQAEELVSLFRSEQDINNPEKYQRADVLVAELERTIFEQRKLHATLPKGAEQMNHDQVTQSIVEVVGAYRHLKMSKKSIDVNVMVNKYNNAAAAANAIRIPG